MLEEHAFQELRELGRDECLQAHYDCCMGLEVAKYVSFNLFFFLRINQHAGQSYNDTNDQTENGENCKTHHLLYGLCIETVQNLRPPIPTIKTHLRSIAKRIWL